MSVETIWTVPAGGERGRTTPDYAAQVARAAEAAGFDGIFVPLDPDGDDAWVLGTALARVAPRLGVSIEYVPAFASAVYAQKMALSFQRFFDERLSVHVRVEAAARGLGDGVTNDDAYARASEYLETAQGLWNDQPLTYHGRFVDVEGAGFFQSDAQHNQRGHRLERRRTPRVVVAGESDAAFGLSARFADVHLFDTLDSERLRAGIDRHRVLASEHGRNARYAARVRVFAREFDDEARRDAQRTYVGAAPPNVVVGNYADIAQRLRSFIDVGISTFVLESPRALESAYDVGQYVLPLLERREAGVKRVIR